MAYEGSGADRYKETAGFIYSCISVVRERNSLGARVLLTSQIDLVASLVQKTCKWGRCDYLLHLLLAGVRAMDHESVLNQIPEEHRELLKKTLAVAIKHPKPDVKAAESERRSSMEKARQNNWNLKSDDKQLNLCNRNAAECALLVAERWNTVIEELKDWAKLLDVPYDENVWQEQKSESKKKHEEPTPPKKPDFPVIDDAYIEHIRNNKAGRGRPRKDKTVAVPPANLVKVSSEEKQKTHSDTITTEDGKELWAISKLEEKLGVKNFAAKKAYYIKHHPTTRGIIERWFEKRGYALYFKSENFAKLQELMFPPKKEKPVKAKKVIVQDTVGLTPVKEGEVRRSDILRTADGKDLWSMQKLEKELKISNFAVKKSRYLKKHPADKKTIEGWFVRRGLVLYFDSTYFDKLKELMCSPTEEPVTEDIKKTVKKVEATPREEKIAPSVTDTNELWTAERLVKELGLVDAADLAKKKFAVLKRNPKCAETVNKWFIKRGHSKLFKSSHLEELKALFDALPKRKRNRTIVEETAIVVAPVVESQPVGTDPIMTTESTEIPVNEGGVGVEKSDTPNVNGGVVTVVNEEETPVPVITMEEPAAPIVEETIEPKIKETVAPTVPAASLPQEPQPLVSVPAFGMADVKAVVSYLEHLMGLIELATKDYQTAEIEYQRAKQEFDRIDNRLNELNKSFGDIKDALVRVEKAETHLANVLEQYLPQQNIVH